MRRAQTFCCFNRFAVLSCESDCNVAAGGLCKNLAAALQTMRRVDDSRSSVGGDGVSGGMLICHKGDIAAGGGEAIVVCPHFIQGHIAADSICCDVLTDVAVLQFNGSRYIVECQFS